MATTWNLQSGIIALSKANDWEPAIKEWELEYIEKLDPNEDSGTCLCGHTPIRELCHIINTKTNHSAIVGNHCILRFGQDDPGHEVLNVAAKIFQASNKILKDPLASANVELIDYAVKKDVFTEANAEFYKSIIGRRNLTEAQVKYKENLNNQLIYGIILSARAAFQRLKDDPNRTAGPKLIQYAFTKRVLNEREKAFYLQIWKRSNDSLTARQKSYKFGLNNRIITQLRPENFDIDRRAQKEVENAKMIGLAAPAASSSSSSQYETRKRPREESEEDDF